MELVTFEIAKKLKEKGFDRPTLLLYNDDGIIPKLLPDVFEPSKNNFYPAPNIYEVLDWLRNEKKIFIAINICYCYESYEKPFPTNPKMEPILKGYYYGVWDLGNLNDENGRSEDFESYELAALAGIEYVLDNLI